MASNLTNHFNEQSLDSPIHPDAQAPKDLKKLEKDPAVTEGVEIITDKDIEKMLRKEGVQDDVMNALNKDSLSPQERYELDNNILKIDKHLARNNPDFYKALSTHLQGMDEEEVNGFKADIFKDIITKYASLPPLLKIPSSNSQNFKQSLEEALEQSGAQNEFSGTLEEYAAIVTMHEKEHSINGQSEIDAYLEEKGNDNPLLKLHHREIDADIGAMHALEDQIAPETLQYVAAMRIGSFADNHMEQSLDRLSLNESNNLCLSNDEPLKIVNSHDTGFFVDHYLQYGEIPDYEQMNSAMNDFYDQTMLFHGQNTIDEMGKQGISSEQALASLQENPPTRGQMVTIVNEALKADPPVYTPEQEQLAQRFLESMETLGIEAEPLNENNHDVAYNNSPAITSTPALC